MAKYKTRPQTVQETLQKLESGVKDFCQSDQYTNYLRTMAKFHSYSYANTVLIAMQKPDATYLAGYRTWQNDFHRNVKKGEHGIRILAPVPVKDKSTEKSDTEAIIHTYFRTVSVFDISQTEGEPLPDDGVHLLTDPVENYTAFFNAIQNISPVPIAFEDIPGGANGYFSYPENRIVIQSGLSESQILKTAVHELTHSILHKQDSDKDRRTKEVEAESTSFAVCSHFGLDTSTYSFGYVAGWSANKELPELKASFQTIHDTASLIISGIEQELRKEHDTNEKTHCETASLRP